MSTLPGREPVLHYEHAGNGETVVLIHGLGANMAFWFMTIGRALARNYHVICYDLRGHGSSGMPDRGYLLPDMVDDLVALLDHLEIERPHVVGHSFGARVALAHAVMHPERLATLTIADTQAKCLQGPMRLREWPHWNRWKTDLVAQGHTGLPADDEIITFELLAHFNSLSPGFANGSLAPDEGAAGAPAGVAAQRGAGGLRRARARGGAGAGGAAPSLRRRDMGRKGSARWTHLMQDTTAKAEFADERPLTVENIARIRVPTLAAYGELSHCLPSCRRLEKLIPRTHVAIVPGAGHFHPAVKPRRFANLLAHFLREHPGASPGQALPRRRRAAARAIEARNRRESP
jgi:pimeloyl-ACP methyl ester carboxylesterase